MGGISGYSFRRKVIFIIPEAVMKSTDEMNDTTDKQVITPGSSPEVNGGTKRGKRHPPPPKPRPPSPPPKEIEAQTSSVDLDGSTSEEDDTPARRVSSRQNKKQKRAQKVNEGKEDRAVLKEMKAPIASTSGPLIREQEKIRKLYPRKFLPASSPKGSNNTSVTDVSPPPPSEEKDDKNGNSVKSKVARQTSAKKVDNDKRATPARATRTSSRISTSKVGNSDNQDQQVAKKVDTDSPQRPSKLSITKTPTSSTISENFKANAKKIINLTPTVTSPPKSLTPTSSVESASTTPTSPPKVTGPILREKRQRKLPKRLSSPDVADLPPVLFRIASSGTINFLNEDEEPPKLSPMASYSPGVPRTRKRPGKENLQLSVSASARKNLEASMIDCSVRIPPLRMDVRRSDDGDKEEDNGEPARKRVARTRTTSSSKENQVNLIDTTKKPEAEEIKSRIGTRASSRKSKA